MKIDVSIKTIWYSESLTDFFFRNQARDTLQDLIERSSVSEEDTLNIIENHYDDLEEFEELCYNESIEYIARECHIELEEEEEEEEEEED